MMNYNGTEAPRLDYAENAWEYDVVDRSYFDVVEGGGVAVRTRQEATADYAVTITLMALAIVTFFFLGAMRVTLTSATVSQLQTNLDTQNAIEQACKANSALRIERSVLCNTARITRIATENYGMVRVASQDSLMLYTPEQIEQMKADAISAAEAEGNASQVTAQYAALLEQPARNGISGAAKQGATELERAQEAVQSAIYEL